VQERGRADVGIIGIGGIIGRIQLIGPRTKVFHIARPFFQIARPSWSGESGCFSTASNTC
jgi:hypothetical protein